MSGMALQVDDLQGSGRYCFTSDEIRHGSGLSAVAFAAALRRLKSKHRVVSPRRGFFVIVPVEYRSAGSPPASWFIEDLMRFLGQPDYYVGLLSAAAIHGAAHQPPQVFQVLTATVLRPVAVGRVRIEFHRNRMAREVPILRVKTETGTMRVATPETTAVDLVRYPRACGYWDNVATVLIELAERLDATELQRVAAKARRPDVQRLGYLLERLGLADLAAPLSRLVGSWHCRPVRLRPERPAGALTPDSRWAVIPNEEISAELHAVWPDNQEADLERAET